jgi:hypothetical protein
MQITGRHFFFTGVSSPLVDHEDNDHDDEDDGPEDATDARAELFFTLRDDRFHSFHCVMVIYILCFEETILIFK